MPSFLPRIRFSIPTCQLFMLVDFHPTVIPTYHNWVPKYMPVDGAGAGKSKGRGSSLPTVMRIEALTCDKRTLTTQRYRPY